MIVHWWQHLTLSHAGAIIAAVCVIGWFILEIVRAQP